MWWLSKSVYALQIEKIPIFRLQKWGRLIQCTPENTVKGIYQNKCLQKKRTLQPENKTEIAIKIYIVKIVFQVSSK